MAVGVIRLSKANGGCTGYPQLVLWCGENHVHLVSATEELGDPTVHAEMILPFLKAWLGERGQRIDGSTVG